MIRKTITLTEQQERWVKQQVESGEYGNDSEYFRDLVRRDQEANAKYRALKAAARNDVDGSVSERTVGEIWAEAEARWTEPSPQKTDALK